jgi:hypothetical protein
VSDIVFECPFCAASLKVDASAVGMQVECPECAKGITIPEAIPSDPEKTVASTANTDTMATPRFDTDTAAPEHRPRAPEKAHAIKPEDFRRLLEETAQAMVPQLEKAASEVRVAFG